MTDPEAGTVKCHQIARQYGPEIATCCELTAKFAFHGDNEFETPKGYRMIAVHDWTGVDCKNCLKRWWNAR
jgi:hypothetical protein